MKLIAKLLAAGASLLAMTAHAQADFIITPIAFTLFAGPLGGALSFGAIYTGVQIAAYAAVLGTQLAIANANRPKINPGEAKNTFQEAESSEVNAIGRVRLGGLKAFGNTRGANIYRLIWHSKGPAVAIETWHVGGREVTVDPSGAVSSPPWARPGGSWMYVWQKVGDGSETSWPALMAAFPALWTAAHRARGIFQSLVRYDTPALDTEDGNKKFQQLYQGGPPDVMVTARVDTPYDPRTGLSAWTDNGILCAAHIMQTYPDLRFEDFDWPFIAAEATRADAVVTTLTGSEPRARCWGIWPSESQRGDTMKQVLDSIGAEVVMSDAGLIRIRLIDDVPASEMTFPALHQVEFNWKAGPDAVERPNVCRIKYYSPERGYDMGEIDMTGIGWARVQSEIDRYGEKIFDVELPFCPSPAQAQRVARRLFLQARSDAGQIMTNMAGLALWGVTYAAIEDADAEELMLCRIAPPRIDDGAGQVDVPFVVWPRELVEQPWNPATMEALPPDPAPELQYESSLATPVISSGMAVVRFPDGSHQLRARMQPVAGAAIAEGTFRGYTSGQPDPWQPMSESGLALAYASVSGPGQFDFRYRYFDADEEGSYFSPVRNQTLAIDDTATAAPTLFATLNEQENTFTLTATAPSSLNVASISAGSIRPTLPGQTHSWTVARPSPGSSNTYVATAFTSNGTATASAPVTVSTPREDA